MHIVKQWRGGENKVVFFSPKWFDCYWVSSLWQVAAGWRNRCLLSSTPFPPLNCKLCRINNNKKNGEKIGNFILRREGSRFNRNVSRLHNIKKRIRKKVTILLFFLLCLFLFLMELTRRVPALFSSSFFLLLHSRSVQRVISRVGIL